MSKGQKLQRMMNLSDRLSKQIRIGLYNAEKTVYSDKRIMAKVNRLYKIDTRLNKLMADILTK